jgi:hypothetical protein
MQRWSILSDNISSLPSSPINCGHVEEEYMKVILANVKITEELNGFF